MVTACVVNWQRPTRAVISAEQGAPRQTLTLPPPLRCRGAPDEPAPWQPARPAEQKRGNDLAAAASVVHVRRQRSRAQHRVSALALAAQSGSVHWPPLELASVCTRPHCYQSRAETACSVVEMGLWSHPILQHNVVVVLQRREQKCSVSASAFLTPIRRTQDRPWKHVSL